MNFTDFGLDSKLLKAIEDLGFKQPTPIQVATFEILLNQSTDLVGLAQTGTGKTAAFGLPLLAAIDSNAKKVQALVLAPTRELCLQISKDFTNFGKYLNGLNIVSVYGGVSIDNQIRDIKRGAQVIVATPGRLVDLLERRAVDLSEVEILVLDEADEMLNMGFKDDLDFILSSTPKERNTWLFSATMPQEVSRIAKKYMKNPQELEVGKRNQGAENIEHIYYVVQSRDRYLALKRIVDYYPEIFGIVFCRTKAETQEVADALIKDGYSADSLHGDLSQAQRDFVMKRFRSRTLQMLVATDVAARGIDINDITHVINYNLPEDAEVYTHRSGRTARAGKTGKSIAIVSMKEVGRIREVEKVIAKKFEKQLIPNGVEVCEKQLFHLVHKLHNVEVNEKEIESYLPKIYDELKDLTKEEIIKRFVSEEFNRFLEYYQNTSDLNLNVRGGGENNSRTVRFFANVGLLDGLNRQSLKDFLAEQVNLNPRMIFNVDVKNSFSFFETETDLKNKFLALNDERINFNTRTLQLEVSENRKSGRGGDSKPFDRRGKFDKKPFFAKGNYGGSKPEKKRERDFDGGSRKSSGSKGGRKEKFGRKSY